MSNCRIYYSSKIIHSSAAGRLTALRMPAGGSPSARSGQALWQTRSYFNWTATNATYPGTGNGRLDEIHIGTTSSNWDRLRLEYDYDSYGNVKRLTENGTANSFTYNTQSQVTAAYSKVYANDVLGRLSNYEGTSPTLNTTFPAYMPKFTGYTFDANGNATARPGQTLVWDVQNRLKEVKNGSTVIESYLYNPDGQRVKRTAGSTNTYYISPFYEVSGSTVTKYYYFNGQRIAMKRGTTLTYLHADHLGSTVLETNSAGSTTTSQTYCAYGRKRTISGGITTCGTNSLVSNEHPSKTGLRRVDTIPFVALSCALIHLPRQQRGKLVPRRHIEHWVDEGVALVKSAALQARVYRRRHIARLPCPIPSSRSFCR